MEVYQCTVLIPELADHDSRHNLLGNAVTFAVLAHKLVSLEDPQPGPGRVGPSPGLGTAITVVPLKKDRGGQRAGARNGQANARSAGSESARRDGAHQEMPTSIRPVRRRVEQQVHRIHRRVKRRQCHVAHHLQEACRPAGTRSGPAPAPSLRGATGTLPVAA
jgi:hypothetical protein